MLTQKLDPTYHFVEVLKLDSLPFSKWVVINLLILWIYVRNVSTRYSGTNTKLQIIHAVIILFLVFLIAGNLNIFSSEKNYLFLLFVPAIIMLGMQPFGNPFSEDLSCEMKFQYILLALPFAYSIGTNANQWEASKLATCFVSIFSLLGLATHSKNIWNLHLMRLMLIASAGISMVSITSAADNPYRQPNPISANQTFVSNIPKLNGMRLNSEYGESLELLQKKIRLFGFKEGTEVIDLSGQSPTLIYLIDGRSTGSSWLIGGYPGSLDVARWQLSRVACHTLRQAWILDEPNGPRSFDFEALLGFFGITRNNYRVVTEWSTPIGSGGFPFQRSQYFLKPIDPKNENIDLKKCRN
jgi:hypothetical protein